MRLRARLSLLAAGLSLACAGARPDRAAEHGPSTRQAAAPDASPLDAGDVAFARRQDPASLAEAIALWERARAERDSVEVRLRLSRARHRLGETAAPQDRLSAFRRGAEDAARALEQSGLPATSRCGEGATAAQVPALYWWLENLAGAARVLGLAEGASERRHALCLARRSAELDPGHFHAGPLRALGRLLAQTPALSGGDLDASARAFARARERAPHFLANHVDFAATWAVKAQDRRAFEAALRQALDAPRGSSPEVEPENELARSRAAALLARASELF